ncbi:ABC transporter permease subunit, partial [Thermus sp.]
MVQSLRPHRWLSLVPFFLPAILTGGGVALPLVYLVLRAAEAQARELWTILLRPKNLELLINTLELLVGVLLTTTLIALPLAFLTTRTNLWGKRAFTVLLTLPLAIPGYVGAYVWLASTGTDGLLPLPRPQGYWGALLVLSLSTYPYLFLSLRAAFLGLDPSLEEAARTLGQKPLNAFWKVVLPQLAPALLSGYLIVALHVLGDFGTVSLFRYDTFSYAIYLQYYAAFDRVYAAWLALGLTLFTGGLLLGEHFLLHRLWVARVSKGSPPQSRPISLGPLTPLGYVLVLLPVLIGVVFPFLALLHLARRFPSEKLLGVWEAFLHSALAAGPAAFLAVGMALPLAYLA